MRNVLIATPEYRESQTDTGNFAYCLSTFYQSLGINVEVVTLHHGADVPSYEPSPKTRVHRLHTRSSQGDVSFGPAAMARIIERVSSLHFDVVFAINSPMIEMISVTGRWSPKLPPLIPISTRDFSTPTSLPLPIIPGIWTPPIVDRPTIAVHDPANIFENETLIKAFHFNDALPNGWSLSVLDRNSGMMTIEQQVPVGDPELIMVTIKDPISITPFLLAEHGVMHVNAENMNALPEAVTEVCRLNRVERQKHAFALWAKTQSPDHSAQRESFWTRLIMNDDSLGNSMRSRDRLKLWRDIELRASTNQTEALIDA